MDKKVTFFYTIGKLLSNSPISVEEINSRLLEGVDEKKISTETRKIKSGLTRSLKLNYIQLNDGIYSVTESGLKYVDSIDNPVVKEKKPREKKVKEPKESKKPREKKEVKKRETKTKKPREKKEVKKRETKPKKPREKKVAGKRKTKDTKTVRTKKVTKKPNSNKTRAMKRIKKNETKVSKPRKYSYTKYEKAIFEAISNLKTRGGSSLIAIVNHVKKYHTVETEDSKFRRQINNAIKKAIDKGYLEKRERSFVLSQNIKRKIKDGSIKLENKYHFGSTKK